MHFLCVLRVLCGEMSCSHGKRTVQRIKIIMGIAVLVFLVATGWQFGSWEVANMNLQEEMRDMASQAGSHIGFIAPLSDDELTRTIILKAKDHGIDLRPDQITLRRTNAGERSTLYLAADYTVPVSLLFFSFNLHFTPTSEKKGP
jgi:hypothetical protein